MKKAFQKIAFVFVSVLLIWSIICFSILCGKELVLILRHTKVISSLVMEFFPLLASLICGIVAAIKFWKRYRHVIIPERNAKRSLRDDNSPSEGVKREISGIFYLAAITLLIWAIFLLLITFMLDIFSINKTYFRAIPYIFMFVLPCIIILICDVYVLCICIKRLGRIIQGKNK